MIKFRTKNIDHTKKIAIATKQSMRKTEANSIADLIRVTRDRNTIEKKGKLI